ncbi:hypothetical protein C9J22_18295 [Photobacterium phosphoreum]|uniref:hypothetical protein n=1 Tax=Photobacterium phosphoreum TaxID=659 RepID=UPI000D177584|nr:hypothetical protein [Photobacterium phosphoreum]PSU68067.1 hypothetical protein C9J22_18295 [Photobacterium phosphoreum]
MNDFTKKKILLFCPSFYNYHNLIKEELRFLGASVILYDERPSNSVIFKVFLRLGLRTFISKSIDKYYDSIIENTNDITDVFFINSEAVSIEILHKIKERYKDAKFTLYMWDSISNKKNIPQIIPIFDKAYSFDPEDCNCIDSLIFEPLFYDKSFEKIRNNKLRYDTCFVGSIHSDRLSIIKKMINYKNISIKYFLFSPSRFFSYFKIITQSNINLKDIEIISHNKISLDKVSDIVGDTKAIIDIQHPNQKGLTMRTFEVLGANKKLITTNEDIKNYDFYSSDNIFILKRDENISEEINNFIKNDFDFKKNKKIKNQRIDNWLMRVLL